MIGVWPEFLGPACNVFVSWVLQEFDMKHDPTNEAVVGWVEWVNASGFEWFVATSGSIRPKRKMTMQWLAYDGMPSRGKEGITKIPL